MDGHARMSGDGNTASGAASGLRDIGERRSADAVLNPPCLQKVGAAWLGRAAATPTSLCALGTSLFVQVVAHAKDEYGVDLKLSIAATRLLMKEVGGVYVSAKANVEAGRTQKCRPDIVYERVGAGREWRRIQHKVIKPAPEDRAAVNTMLRGKKEGDIFSTADQQLMNVQLRWWGGVDGEPVRQERPVLYLNHDEKVFWAHDGVIKEWRFANPTEEPGVSEVLHGKGFGSAVMAAVFMSVLGIFKWEVRRYGGKNGYWNSACMARHMTEALQKAAAEYPAVRKQRRG
jgi:hypothetical protein